MPELSSIQIFVIAAIVLLITPGPAVLYIMARSIHQGRAAGIVSVLGISVGTLVHVAAAALGISALLVSSALAFNALKYVGAAYLIFLGIQKLVRKEEASADAEVPQEPLSRIFLQGIVVNILNPKTALFFMAFLPQFVSVERGNVAGQILFLGLLFVVLSLFSDGIYALLAGKLGQWLKNNVRFLRAQRYFAGSVYIGMGIATAISGSRKK